MRQKIKPLRFWGLLGAAVAVIGILIVAAILVLSLKSYLSDLDTEDISSIPPIGFSCRNNLKEDKRPI